MTDRRCGKPGWKHKRSRLGWGGNSEAESGGKCGEDWQRLVRKGRSNGLGKPEARRSWHEAKSPQTMSGCPQLQLEWVPLMPSPGCEPPTPARHRRRRYIFRRRRRNAHNRRASQRNKGEDFPTPSISTPLAGSKLAAIWQLSSLQAECPQHLEMKWEPQVPMLHPPVFREAEAREMVRA